MGQQQRPNSEDKKVVTLGRVLQTLREEDNVDVLIDTTINYLQAEFDYSLIWIGFYDRLDHRILGKGGIVPTGDINFLKQRIFLNPGDLLEQVVIQLRPIGVPDLRQETRAGEWRKAAANFNIRGTLIFPIRYRDRCFGVVMLGSLQWGISPQPEEKARLSMLLGGLAASLNQIETDWNRQRTKRPDEPLFRILEQLRSTRTILQRLETVVAETHQFVAPTRTSIYWFERERRYFWRRMSNRASGSFGDAVTKASGITVQESGGFYNALVADQMVSIGEAHSSLKADITSRLLQRLGVRSLLAAPIRLGDELLGFLAVEGNEPRIWKEEEKNYLRGAAQLIAMFSPIEEMEVTVEQTKQDRMLTAEIASAITSEEDWQKTLKICAEQLTTRLQVDRFLVLLFDPDQKHFEICFQTQPVNRRPIVSQTGGKDSSQTLPSLSDVDWQLLERSPEAVAIEDLSTDLKLLGFRNAFLEAGVRSLLTCNTSLKRPLTGLLIVTSENPRTWTSAEREIFRVVSQQIGLIINQRRLIGQLDRQQKSYQSLQWGLTTMQQAFSLEHIEKAALQSIATMLQAPVAALVSWSPRSKEGRILTTDVSNYQFAIDSNFIVPIRSDELIQEALASDGLLVKDVTNISPATRSWISGPGISEIMVMPLQTAPEHEPTGVAIVAKGTGSWPNSALPMFGLLTSQLAWLRRYKMLIDSLSEEREELQCLNWYKHRLIADLARQYLQPPQIELVEDLSRQGAVKELRQPAGRFHSSPAIKNSKDLLTKQDSRHGGLAIYIYSMLANEQWKIGYRELENGKVLSDDGIEDEDSEKNSIAASFASTKDSIRLTSLLLRSLDRIDPAIKQKRIWAQIHDTEGEKALTTNLSKKLDIVKIELVIHEILMAACDRVRTGGRIDIWCRQLGHESRGYGEEELSPSHSHHYPPDRFIELSVTDDGAIDPVLIAELQQAPSDDLVPSTLDKPPGLHLRICQSIVRQMAGELNFYQIDDGRVLSRLLIPLRD
ncbi:sensor histidine kinase [Aerosakkonema funiforme]|uniref:GAF domain-containing protein n=3 Tax=Oscillatoriophycideae TaxID=1301283 RepID=A0A926ZJN4_9CYAN|nr:GAF domain-containing protein [Aerosakkonema funiforme]MBD2184839.1 GAF domain-containing protein [Aerosakkonema funiforme FACHB-1375]